MTPHRPTHFLSLLLAASLLAESGCALDDGGDVDYVDDGSDVDDVDAGVEAVAAGGCPSYRLKHLHASMQRTDTVVQRRGSIDAAFDAGADTISWTEIENIEAVRRIDNRNGWRTFWPSGQPEVRAKNAVPISWRRDVYQFIRGESVFSSEGRAKVAPSRWVTRVWLRHRKSKEIQSRMAHHSVAGVDGAGQAPVKWRRRAHAKNIESFRLSKTVSDCWSPRPAKGEHGLAAFALVGVFAAASVGSMFAAARRLRH